MVLVNMGKFGEGNTKGGRFVLNCSSYTNDPKLMSFPVIPDVICSRHPRKLAVLAPALSDSGA
jgi:hypothetical protein